MVTIRCTVNGQTADISSIPTLSPGEIAVTECSFQAPIDGTFMTVDAIVDGEKSSMSETSQQEMEASLTLSQPEIVDDTDVDAGVSTTTIYVGSLIALIVIIAGFTWLAPAKIRKYE